MNQSTARQPVFLYEYHEQPAATFYLDRPVRYADSISELDGILQSGGRRVAIVPKRRYEELAQSFAQRDLRLLEETKGLQTDLVLLAKD